MRRGLIIITSRLLLKHGSRHTVVHPVSSHSRLYEGRPIFGGVGLDGSPHI